MAEKNKKANKVRVEDSLPLGGDYALDANDNPVVVYEDRSGRRKVKDTK